MNRNRFLHTFPNSSVQVVRKRKGKESVSAEEGGLAMSKVFAILFMVIILSTPAYAELHSPSAIEVSIHKVELQLARYEKKFRALELDRLRASMSESRRDKLERQVESEQKNFVRWLDSTYDDLTAALKRSPGGSPAGIACIHEFFRRVNEIQNTIIKIMNWLKLVLRAQVRTLTVEAGEAERRVERKKRVMSIFLGPSYRTTEYHPSSVSIQEGGFATYEPRYSNSNSSVPGPVHSAPGGGSSSPFFGSAMGR